MAEVMDRTAQTQHGIAVRRFTSPNRILARSFRLSRDKWKLKHHQVQAKLKQAKQLACERGTARDRWREQCEQATARIVAAEATAAQLQDELAQARIAAMETAPKKNADATGAGPGRPAGARFDAAICHRRVSAVGGECGSVVASRAACAVHHVP